MKLIECLFGISPDGGSGLIEWLLLLMAVAVPANRYLRRCRRAQRAE